MVGSGQENGRVIDGTLGSGADFSGGFPRAQLSRVGQPAVRKAGVPIRMAAERLGSRVGGWNLREQRERVGAVGFLGEGAFPDKPAPARILPRIRGVLDAPRLPRPRGRGRDRSWLANLGARASAPVMVGGPVGGPCLWDGSEGGAGALGEGKGCVPISLAPASPSLWW